VVLREQLVLKVLVVLRVQREQELKVLKVELELRVFKDSLDLKEQMVLLLLRVLKVLMVLKELPVLKELLVLREHLEHKVLMVLKVH